jgi:hypothetical protein
MLEHPAKAAEAANAVNARTTLTRRRGVRFVDGTEIMTRLPPAGRPA